MSAAPSNAPKTYPVTLPSGREATFRLLGGQERRTVMAMVLNEVPQDTPSDRVFTDHVLACIQFALVTDSGKPVNPDYKARYDDWSDADQEFYMTLYREMTSLAPDERKRAQALAKSLLGR